MFKWACNIIHIATVRSVFKGFYLDLIIPINTYIFFNSYIIQFSTMKLFENRNLDVFCHWSRAQYFFEFLWACHSAYLDMHYSVIIVRTLYMNFDKVIINIMNKHTASILSERTYVLFQDKACKLTSCNKQTSWRILTQFSCPYLTK